MSVTTARPTDSARRVPATRNRHSEAVVSSPWIGRWAGAGSGGQAALLCCRLVGTYRHAAPEEWIHSSGVINEPDLRSTRSGYSWTVGPFPDAAPGHRSQASTPELSRLTRCKLEDIPSGGRRQIRPAHLMSEALAPGGTSRHCNRHCCLVRSPWAQVSCA